jgi:hypothetical protein
VGRVRTRSQLCLRSGNNLFLPSQERARPHLSRSPSCLRWIRVFRQETAGHCLFCPQLLRRVQQLGSDDAHRRQPHLLIPGTATLGKIGPVQKQTEDATQAWRLIFIQPVHHRPIITEIAPITINITHSLYFLSLYSSFYFLSLYSSFYSWMSWMSSCSSLGG